MLGPLSGAWPTPRYDRAVVTFTDRAAASLARSADAAGRFDPGVRIRISREGTTVRASFVHEAEDGDAVVHMPDGSEVAVASDVHGTIDVGEHDTLMLLA